MFYSSVLIETGSVHFLGTVPQRELYGIRPCGMGGIGAAPVAKGKCDVVAGTLLFT